MSRYHSALRPPSAAPRLDRHEGPSGVAFVHDLTVGVLPPEFDDCDVLYSDLPWRAGFERFNRRARLSDQRTHGEFIDAVNRIVAETTVPAYLVAGKNEGRWLAPTDVQLPLSLNGAKAVCYSYRSEIPDVGDATSLLHWLAGRYSTVGDFCCGYGRSGRIFVEHGKRYVLSDVNATCVGVIAGWAT